VGALSPGKFSPNPVLCTLALMLQIMHVWVCHLFGISSPTYSRILTEFLNKRSVYSQERGGNEDTKACQIPNTKGVQELVRNFV
jgi:hypothetical protein